MSEESPKKSSFLSGKPEISAVGQSDLFSRLRTFLPQMDEANKKISAESTTDAFEIVEEQSSSSSDSSDSDESDCDLNVQEEKIKKKKDNKNNKNEKNAENPLEKRIEIDLDVFQEQNSRVDDQDVSVHVVDNLPVAFQRKSEISEKIETKKPLIEEI